MADSAQQAKIGEMKAAFSPNFAEAQERNAAFITRVNEVMVNTARAMWESEMELFRLETEQAAKTFAPTKFGDDPMAAASAYSEQWQEGSEKLLNHMRTLSDLAHKCGWDLLHIYQDNFSANWSKAVRRASQKTW